jgi:2-oxoglutarate ferredoxin oxidoreductase subunit alpha
MRDGPSTGSPTFTSQGDLNFALHASFGETTPIVLVPSTFEEAYSMMGLAFNRADLYQHPVILLTDKQLMEGYKTIEEKDLVSPEINRGEVASAEDTDMYLRYKNTENGLSPYAIPGQENTLFIATSYEHDESGATNEEPSIKQQQMEKRFRKRLTFYTREYAKDFVAYEVINPQAENFFITRGINRYNLEALIEGKSDRGVIVIKTFHPFSAHLSGFFKDHQNQIKKLIFVEMNYNGLMEKLVISECGLIGPEREEKISHFRKYSLYPIFKEEVEELL